MKIGIVGLGLIGGSIGLALKSKKVRTRFSGHKIFSGDQIEEIIGIARRDETIDLAIKIGAIDEGVSEEAPETCDCDCCTEGGIALEALAVADIIFLCTPIHLILPKIKELQPILKQGAIVVDVASVKGAIVSKAEKLMKKGTHFIGSHPMAGKEKAKLQNAEPNLFEGRPWIIVSGTKTGENTKEIIKALIEAIGGKVMEMNSETHDLAVAGISHLPLAVAAALVNTVENSKIAKNEMKKTASSGFRDTTRVASGEVELGREIFIDNKKAILAQLKAFRANLGDLEKAIQSGNSKKIETLLAKAKKSRDGLYQ